MIHLYEFVTTRDGIRLATDIYLPHADGRFPTIVQRTPYGKQDERLVAYAEWMAEKGYASVIQDVRGRYDSQGDWHPYENHEDTDGFDTIDWVVAQRWSNGAVAFAGSSYLAFTGYMAALSGHPALKALIARVPASGLYHHHFYMGGIFFLGRLCWGTLVNRRGCQIVHGNGVREPIFNKIIAENPDIFLHLPVAEIGELFAMPVPWWRTWLQHPDEDEYWRRIEILHCFDRLTIPIYHISGWHDDFCLATLKNHLAAVSNAKAERRLLMGMWPHQVNQGTEYGGIEYGPEAAIDLYRREKEFLDRHLLGLKNCLEDEPPVRIFIMGRNHWGEFSSWPPDKIETRPLYLRAEGELSFNLPATGETQSGYDYDPEKPTLQPWDFGEPDLPVVPDYEFSDRTGKDRLFFYLPPVLREMAVIGPIKLILHAATSAPDTDWFAWLGWENPADGRIRLLTYGGCLRARYRNGFHRPQLLQPNEVFPYEIDLGATARVLPTGTRLILCLQSSGMPWFARNLNRGGNDYLETETATARQTVFHQADHPSRLLLPIMNIKDLEG